MDLLDAIATMLDFRYEIFLVPDGQFGDKDKDGKWNGLVGQLLQGVSECARV